MTYFFEEMSAEDRSREERILLYAEIANGCASLEVAKVYLGLMRHEILQRSPEQVARMERSLGLSARPGLAPKLQQTDTDRHQ
ncbi:hypothetical protein NDR89_15560 [Cupriavidus gilardii]|uniref:Uncharacterized protein n=1 Tax=Cupriavidus gilardii TaxID=82541 RepID=A0ABY4VV16_9BURK|nr:hypothetical protein [Cupriavidus gilardii]USE81136.1 hypothetical protein NDR89_15560 [Cupriavidus gilardii]